MQKAVCTCGKLTKDEELVAAIASSIYELRIRRGLTQAKFAKHLGIMVSVLNKLEDGDF